MNKLMILSILVAYKAFNNKSISIVVNEGEGEYVANNAIIDSIDTIDGGTVSVFTSANDDVYYRTINIDYIISIQFQE